MSSGRSLAIWHFDGLAIGDKLRVTSYKCALMKFVSEVRVAIHPPDIHRLDNAYRQFLHLLGDK